MSVEDARPYLKRLPGDKYQLAAASGADWTVHDYRIVDGRRERLKLGSKVAVYRAFVPEAGHKRVYKFQPGESHSPDPFDLERQLSQAQFLAKRPVRAPYESPGSVF